MRLDTALLADLNRLAQENERTVAGEVRLALREYVERHNGRKEAAA